MSLKDFKQRRMCLKAQHHLSPSLSDPPPYPTPTPHTLNSQQKLRGGNTSFQQDCEASEDISWAPSRLGPGKGSEKIPTEPIGSITPISSKGPPQVTLFAPSSKLPQSLV